MLSDMLPGQLIVLHYAASSRLEAVCVRLTTLRYHSKSCCCQMSFADCSLCLSFVHDAADQAERPITVSVNCRCGVEHHLRQAG